MGYVGKYLSANACGTFEENGKSRRYIRGGVARFEGDVYRAGRLDIMEKQAMVYTLAAFV